MFYKHKIVNGKNTWMDLILKGDSDIQWTCFDITFNKPTQPFSILFGCTMTFKNIHTLTPP